jgi:hypothetical protein
MLDNVLATNWILQVADVSAQLKVDISRVAAKPPPEAEPGDKNIVLDFQRMVENEALRAERLNALRTADTRLQRADPQYATRAGSNNAHFLLPRPRTDTTALEYAQLVLSPGSEVSAIGVYAWFHLSALQKATRLASEQLAPAERQALARAMLADEGFALHFLQDSFSAGHVAGAWGDVSQRKGTHDYYNEYGLEAFTWTGGSHSMVLMGDAHMRLEDLERAAVAVRTSLEQVVDHASGRGRTVRVPHTPTAPGQPDALDICKTSTFAQRGEGLRATPEALRAGARSARSDAGARPGPRAGLDAALPRRGRHLHRLRRRDRPARRRWRVRPGDHCQRLARRRRSLDARRPRPRRRARARAATAWCSSRSAFAATRNRRAGDRCPRRRSMLPAGWPRSRRASASRLACGCRSISFPAICSSWRRCTSSPRTPTPTWR